MKGEQWREPAAATTSRPETKPADVSALGHRPWTPPLDPPAAEIRRTESTDESGGRIVTWDRKTGDRSVYQCVVNETLQNVVGYSMIGGQSQSESAGTASFDEFPQVLSLGFESDFGPTTFAEVVATVERFKKPTAGATE